MCNYYEGTVGGMTIKAEFGYHENYLEITLENNEKLLLSNMLGFIFCWMPDRYLFDWKRTKNQSNA